MKFKIILVALLASCWSAQTEPVEVNGILDLVNHAAAFDYGGEVLFMQRPTGPWLSFSNGVAVTVEMWAFMIHASGNPGLATPTAGFNFLGNGATFGIVLKSKETALWAQNTWIKVLVPMPRFEWVHLAVSYDAGTGLFQLYTNGLLIASIDQAYDPSTGSNGLQPIKGRLLVGFPQPWVPSGLRGGLRFGGDFGGGFVGYLDEVRIWNIARSQAEIRQGMNQTLSGSELGLVGYWNFDDGTSRDLTGHGINGRLRSSRIDLYAVPPKATEAAIE